MHRVGYVNALFGCVCVCVHAYLYIYGYNCILLKPNFHFVVPLVSLLLFMLP